MVERFADKQIKVFEAILTNQQVEGSFDILSQDTDVDDEHFREMLNFLDLLELIKLNDIWEISIIDDRGTEFTLPDELAANIKILDRPALEKQLVNLKKEYPKKTKPLLRPQTTELIARAIGEIASKPKLQWLFESFGVEKSLIVSPNDKCKMAQDVLDYLALSDRPEDVLALETILREFCHPLMYDGDTERAKSFEKKLNGWLEYEGYRVVRGQLINITDEEGEWLKNPLTETQAVGSVTTTKKAISKIASTLEIDESVRAKFAQAANWESIRLEFTGDGNRIEVFIADETAGEYHFDELGFQKRSSTRSTFIKSWGMLQDMGITGGDYAYGSKDTSTKKDLTKRLKIFFPHLLGDPITCDSGQRKYRSRIKITHKDDSRQTYMDRMTNRRLTKEMLGTY